MSRYGKILLENLEYSVYFTSVYLTLCSSEHLSNTYYASVITYTYHYEKGHIKTISIFWFGNHLIEYIQINAKYVETKLNYTV